MRKDLEERLRAVYETGRLKRHRDDLLYDLEYREDIHNSLCARMEHLGKKVSRQPVYYGQVVFEWAITDSRYPGFSEWTGLPYEKKVEWCGVNDRSYPVLWLQCSRVWPAYYWYYNIWSKPGAGKTGLVECLNEPYGDRWLPVHEEIACVMRDLNIVSLTHDELLEPAPFVMNEMWIESDDDPVDECDDEDEPTFNHLDDTVVVQCLFQNY